MTRTIPTFLVAGAGRAGTTGLVEGLREHPSVFITTPKEPHYFAMHGFHPDFRGPGDDESINRRAVTNEDDYLALFPADSDATAYGEGSVSTLYYWEHALPELLRINPGMRVVVLLREPVARAHSSFQYLRANGREPEEDFLVAVSKEPERRADNWHHLWHYTSMSLYADALTAFSQELRPNHLGVWFHDDLERDYATTYNDILRFLDLPVTPGVGDDVPRVNISGTPRSRALQGALIRAQASPVLRQTARTVTSWRFREAVRSRLLQREAVSDDVRRQLAPVFAEDLARVRELLAPADRMPEWLLQADGAPAA